jgi:hypothetical protein
VRALAPRRPFVEQGGMDRGTLRHLLGPPTALATAKTPHLSGAERWGFFCWSKERSAKVAPRCGAMERRREP